MTLSSSSPQQLQELTTFNTGINTAPIPDIDDQTVDTPIQEEQQKQKQSCIALRWWFDPLIWNIIHSICCFIYHCYNFGFTIGIFIFEILAISFSISLTFLACIGIVLLWLTFEMILILSQIDLLINYHLIELKKNKNNEMKSLLQLSVYTKHLPHCGCNGFCGILWQRFKHLFTSCNMYTIIIYHITIRPLITLITCWPVAIIYYICIGILAPFFIPNLWVALCVSLVSLIILLPLSLRISNYCAKMSKSCSYYFYTYYYDGNDKVADQQVLIQPDTKVDNNLLEV